MAENKNRMNNEPVFGSLAYDLNTLNWEQLDGNAVRQLLKKRDLLYSLLSVKAAETMVQSLTLLLMASR